MQDEFTFDEDNCLSTDLRWNGARTTANETSVFLITFSSL